MALVETYDIDDAATTTRLMNTSARAQVGVGDRILIPGTVISGIGSRRLLIRAIGPSLAQFGVTGLLANPIVAVMSGSTAIAINDDWSTSSNAVEISNASTQVNAFPLALGSKDSAVIVTLAPGSYTIQVSGSDGGAGTALVENLRTALGLALEMSRAIEHLPGAAREWRTQLCAIGMRCHFAVGTPIVSR